MSSLAERIKVFMTEKGLSARQFEQAIGAGNGTIGKAIQRNSDIGSMWLQKIVQNYPEVDPMWWAFGDGKMYKKIAPNIAPKPASNPERWTVDSLAGLLHKIDDDVNAAAMELHDVDEPEYKTDVPRLPPAFPRVVTVDLTGENAVIYVPNSERAGYLKGYTNPDFISKLPAFRLPWLREGFYRIFEVDGNKMFNTLADRDKVSTRWIKVSDIREDRVHVLITKNNGIMINRLLNRYDVGKIICKYDHNHHGENPDVVLDVHEILEAWYVEERYTRQLSRPGEIYKRIALMEGDIALMRHEWKKNQLKDG